MEKIKEWVSVNDRLPDSAIIVLCATNKGIFMGYVIEQWGKDGNYYRDWYSQPAGTNKDNNATYDVTHWQHLPNHPNGELGHAC